MLKISLTEMASRLDRFLVTVLFFFLISVSGEGSAFPASGQSPIKSAYSQVPFSGKVTVGYRGNDPRAVLRALNAVRPKEKSEFETTAHYEERLANSADVPLYGALRTSSIFAFVFPSVETPSYPGGIDPGSLEISYDADTETMSAKLGIGSVYNDAGEHSKDIRSIVWNWARTGRGDYIGSNAFGAIRTVKKSVSVSTGLAFSIDSPFYSGRGDWTDDFYPSPIGMTFSVPASRAKMLKKNLRVLVVASLLQPTSIEESVHREPKIDHPYDTAELGHYLHVDIQEIWLFDSSTGEVVAKATPR